MNKYIIFSIFSFLAMVGIFHSADAAWYAVNNETKEESEMSEKSIDGILLTKNGPSVRSLGSTVEEVYYDEVDFETVIFTISITVYSDTEDVYISDMASTTLMNQASTLRLYKDGSNVMSPVTTAVYTDASMTDGGNYFVEKGTVERFDFKLEYSKNLFEDDEPYYVRLRNIKWNNTDGDSYKTKILNTDFTTEEMYF